MQRGCGASVAKIHKRVLVVDASLTVREIKHDKPSTSLRSALNLRAGLTSRSLGDELNVLRRKFRSAGVCNSPSDCATLLNAFVDRLGEIMTESDVLPYDG